MDTSAAQSAYNARQSEVVSHLNRIQQIVVDSKEPLEGNAFYYHNSLTLYKELFPKQVNLFWCGSQAKARICEIGFNAGHSALLMLLGRTASVVEFTVFDIGQHAYVKPAIQYIQTAFSAVKIEYVEGDSTVEMPKWMRVNMSLLGQYDVVHVDGGHSEHCIQNDLLNAVKLVALHGLIIIDDTNVDYINSRVDFYIQTGYFSEIEILKTQGYLHRIIRRIK